MKLNQHNRLEGKLPGGARLRIHYHPQRADRAREVPRHSSKSIPENRSENRSLILRLKSSLPRWPRPRSQPERQENVPRGRRESGREEQQVEVGRRFRRTVETRKAVSGQEGTEAREERKREREQEQ